MRRKLRFPRSWGRANRLSARSVGGNGKTPPKLFFLLSTRVRSRSSGSICFPELSSALAAAAASYINNLL